MAHTEASPANLFLSQAGQILIVLCVANEKEKHLGDMEKVNE